MLTSRQGRPIKVAGQSDVHPCHHSRLRLMRVNNQHRDQHRNSVASGSCSRISRKASDLNDCPPNFSFRRNDNAPFIMLIF